MKLQPALSSNLQTYSPARHIAKEYRTLLQISEDIIKTQPILDRGIAYASGGLNRAWIGAKQSIAQALSQEYEVADLLDVVQLQRRQVGQYNVCIDTITVLMDAHVSAMQREQQSALQSLGRLQSMNDDDVSRYAVKVNENAISRLETTTQTLHQVKTLLCKYRLSGSDYQSLLEHTIEPMVAMGLCTNKATKLHGYMASAHRFTSSLEREFKSEMRLFRSQIG